MSLFVKASPISKKILLFWFDQIPCTSFRDIWFKKSNVMDSFIQKEFTEYLPQVNPYKIDKNAYDTLAKIILYDQFPRNIYGNSAKNHIALTNSKNLLNTPVLKNQTLEHFTKHEWAFVYMPFLRSEKSLHQNKIVKESHCFRNNIIKNILLNNPKTR